MKTYKILDTTDDKYMDMILKIESDNKITLDGKEFKYQKIQKIGNGLYRYSNSNYVILVKEINNG